jgi:hypothetical protein
MTTIDQTMAPACKVVLYHLTELIKLEKGILPCTKVSDLMPLLENQFKKDTGKKLASCTLGKWVTELERRKLVEYRKIDGVHGITLGEAHGDFGLFAELYAEEDKRHEELRRGFEALFVKNNKGNYYYTVDYQKFVTIFQQKTHWRWVYDGTFSQNIFASPFDAYVDLKKEAIVKLAVEDETFSIPKKPKTSEEGIDDEFSFDPLTEATDDDDDTFW